MSVTISRPDLFPNGTSVSAYEATGLGRTPTSGAPSGTAVETEVVASGSMTFSDLLNGRTYILYASSPDRYLRVTPSAVQGSRGTVMWTTGGVPPRAYGYHYTDWIGPDDPAANAIDGDTWIDA